MQRSPIALSLALALAWSAPAWAHAHPHQLVPKANAVLTAAPAQVSLTFDEEVQPGLTRAEVKNDGHVVSVGKGTVDSKTHKQLTVPLAKAGAGKYVVSWHALAADGHASSGQYTFTVKPATTKP